MNKNRITVIIATHKKYQMPADPMYLPLHVGAAGKESIGYQRDDDGENISELNPFFCELTGVYWAWKNLEADYIGLVHYRRHFSFHPYLKNKWKAILTESEIKDEIEKIKVFVPVKRRYYIETLYSHYAHTHYAYQLDVTRKIIEEKYPLYVESYDSVVNKKYGYMFNMFIMSSELLSDYCCWLFDVLFELKKRIGAKEENTLSTFQARFYGRISEIIFNVWLDYQVKRNRVSREEIKEIPIIHMEKINWAKKGGAFLKAKFTGKRYEGSF